MECVLWENKVGMPCFTCVHFSKPFRTGEVARSLRRLPHKREDWVTVSMQKIGMLVLTLTLVWGTGGSPNPTGQQEGWTCWAFGSLRPWLSKWCRWDTLWQPWLSSLLHVYIPIQTSTHNTHTRKSHWHTGGCSVHSDFACLSGRPFLVHFYVAGLHWMELSVSWCGKSCHTHLPECILLQF